VVKKSSVGNGLFGLLIEDVDLTGLKSDIDGLAGMSSGGRRNTTVDVLTFANGVEIFLSTHKLGNFNVSLNNTVGELLDEFFLVMYVLRTDTDDNILADIFGASIKKLLCFSFVKVNLVARWTLLDAKVGQKMLDRLMAELDGKQYIEI
jgi:hypothetical protein